MSGSRDEITSEHGVVNQTNYNKKAKEHDSLGLDSTLYLAYRDINSLLERHLYPNLTDNTIRMLDFGCGVGLSTEVIEKQITNTGRNVKIVGVDINEENLNIARTKIPQGTFHRIAERSSLDVGQFNLIICNFVLVEMKSNEMLEVIKSLKSKLAKDGILIVTNPTARAYRPENNWYTFNNHFSENTPTRQSEKSDKLKYEEDQPIKVQVFSAKGSNKNFSFFDFFHSGFAYRKTYLSSGLRLLETHKPIGKVADQKSWESESTKPPYKIHVLGRN